MNTPAALPDQRFRYYDLIMVAFVVILLLGNTVAIKMVQLGPWVAGADILIFPVSYIFGDILTEVYGYQRSRRVIWTGFVALAFMVVLYTLAVRLPPSSSWEGQEAYQAVLGQLPRFALASVLAFWLGGFCNSFVLAKLKVATQGRWLWTRTIGSTLVGQTVDTTVFGLVAFLGASSGGDLFGYIAFGIVSKVLYETVATPITYAIVHWLKRAEGIDHYDTTTDFNPFNLRLDDRATA
jgi:queuosine precursor transporter